MKVPMTLNGLGIAFESGRKVSKGYLMNFACSSSMGKTFSFTVRDPES
jgi:hypothetical protein